MGRVPKPNLVAKSVHTDVFFGAFLLSMILQGKNGIREVIGGKKKTLWDDLPHKDWEKNHVSHLRKKVRKLLLSVCKLGSYRLSTKLSGAIYT